MRERRGGRHCFGQERRDSADRGAGVRHLLGKNSALPGGGAATPVDQADGSPLRDQFYTKVSSKSAAQMKAYWAKQIFTGKGQAPKEAGDSAAVKAAVAGNPNLIGYIDRSAVDATVKVLLTVK